jgi:hypothetical protein
MMVDSSTWTPLEKAIPSLKARLHVAAGPDNGFSRSATVDNFVIWALASATYAEARMMSSRWIGVERQLGTHNLSILVRGGMVR